MEFPDFVEVFGVKRRVRKNNCRGVHPTHLTVEAGSLQFYFEVVPARGQKAKRKGQKYALLPFLYYNPWFETSRRSATLYRPRSRYAMAFYTSLPKVKDQIFSVQDGICFLEERLKTLFKELFDVIHDAAYED